MTDTTTMWDWIVEARKDWDGAYGAEISAQAVALALKDLVKAYGWDRLRPCWQAYLKYTSENQADPRYFAQMVPPVEGTSLREDFNAMRMTLGGLCGSIAKARDILVAAHRNAEIPEPTWTRGTDDWDEQAARYLEERPKEKAMPESKPEIKVGDVVRLKSGGPDMTVQDLEAGVRCVWFSLAAVTTGLFKAETLTLSGVRGDEQAKMKAAASVGGGR